MNSVYIKIRQTKHEEDAKLKHTLDIDSKYHLHAEFNRDIHDYIAIRNGKVRKTCWVLNKLHHDCSPNPMHVLLVQENANRNRKYLKQKQGTTSSERYA